MCCKIRENKESIYSTIERDPFLKSGRHRAAVNILKSWLRRGFILKYKVITWPDNKTPPRSRATHWLISLARNAFLNRTKFGCALYTAISAGAIRGWMLPKERWGSLTWKKPSLAHNGIRPASAGRGWKWGTDGAPYNLGAHSQTPFLPGFYQ